MKLLKGNKKLAQKAWNYINDAYKTTSVINFPPNVIATSALYMAIQVLDFPLPDLEWWKIFGVKFEDICKINF